MTTIDRFDYNYNHSLPPSTSTHAEWTDDVAQFRGPKKPPVTKECVLIIDTVSGEAVLERISNNIQLKAIRLLVGHSGRVKCIMCVH